MTALVTGVAGFIGSHLAESLLDDGVGVRGVDRFSDYYDPALKRDHLELLTGRDGFELVEGDLNSVGMDELLEEVDVIYHLAGQPGVRVSWGTEFEIYTRDNVLSTQRMLEACRDHSLERFVLASSSSIYGDAESFPTNEDARPAPVSPYGLTKLTAEHLCRLYHRSFGIPTVALRYFTIFGPRQRPDMAFTRFIDAALTGGTIEVFGDGLQERDFTYVADAVSATVAAGSRGEPGGVYNVAGGNHATVAEVLETLGELLGDTPAIKHEAPVIGDARKTGADTTRAREVLGYEPRTSLREGLANQVAEQRAEQARSGGGLAGS
jgi:nucleoside-diphosphate-sugar epimerase